jgi:AcrR family transcriptional regulator
MTVAAQREQIIDGAEAAIRRWGLGRTRIEDIVAESGIGRSTVYRHFGNRETVIIEVLLRRGRRYGDGLLAHLRAIDNPADKIVEGIIFALEFIRKDEMLWAMFRREGIPETAKLAEGVQPLFDLATALWVESLRSDPALQAALRPGVDERLAAEWMLRTMLSYLAIPGAHGENPKALRRDLRLLLLPALIEEIKV